MAGLTELRDGGVGRGGLERYESGDKTVSDDVIGTGGAWDSREGEENSRFCRNAMPAGERGETAPRIFTMPPSESDAFDKDAVLPEVDEVVEDIDACRS